MTKKMVRLTSLLLSLCLAGAVAAGAQSGPGGGPEREGMRHGWMNEFMNDLNLTPEQQQKLRDLRGKGAGMRERHEEMRSKRQKLIDLIKVPGSDEATIFALVEEVNKLHAAMNTDRVKRMLAMKKILTPQQFTTLSERIREHTQEHFKQGERPGGRFGHGPRGDREPEPEL